MRVLVTRPASQATEWVDLLKARGIDAVALPLIGIAPANNTMPVVLAWVGLGQRKLVMFVSPNAVDQFFAHKPPGLVWPPQVLAASPGPGTTRTLVRHGVPAEQIIEPATHSAQFDSEALWLQLREHDWKDASVLIVRGEGGRDWLADTLEAHGAKVTKLAAYRSSRPKFSAGERALIEAAVREPQTHLWMFSSSEAITNLATAVTFANWGKAWALTTHPRIAARAQELGFSNIIQTRPALDAVSACIQSLAT